MNKIHTSVLPSINHRLSVQKSNTSKLHIEHLNLLKITSFQMYCRHYSLSDLLCFEEHSTCTNYFINNGCQVNVSEKTLQLSNYSFMSFINNHNYKLTSEVKLTLRIYGWSTNCQVHEKQYQEKQYKNQYQHFGNERVAE